MGSFEESALTSSWQGAGEKMAAVPISSSCPVSSLGYLVECSIQGERNISFSHSWSYSLAPEGQCVEEPVGPQPVALRRW